MAETIDEVKATNYDNRTRYKFMANLFNTTLSREIYVTPLEKITSNAGVPFIRIILSMIFGAAVVIGSGFVLFGNKMRAPYVWFAVVVMAVALLTMTVIFMLSTYEGSMLFATAKLNLFNFDERRRERQNLTVKSLGIKHIDDYGKIKFGNGDVGVIYLVKGILSQSTLPDTAQYVADCRHRYLVARTPTCQEIRITSVEPNQLNSQRKDLKAVISAHKKETPKNLWINEMAQAQIRYFDELARQGRQLTLNQVVIIREIDDDKLNKSCIQFERAVATGLYDRCDHISSKKQIIAALSGVAMLEGDKQNAN